MTFESRCLSSPSRSFPSPSTGQGKLEGLTTDGGPGREGNLFLANNNRSFVRYRPTEMHKSDFFYRSPLACRQLDVTHGPQSMEG